MTGNVEDRLRSWLVLKARWAYPLLVRWPLVLADGFHPSPTVLGMADGRRTYLRSDILDGGAPLSFAGFVLLHELLHNLRRDPQRLRYRASTGLGGRPLDHELARLAVEHCNNVVVADALGVPIPDSGVDLTRMLPAFPREWETWEACYMHLLDAPGRCTIPEAGGAMAGDVDSVAGDAADEMESEAATAEAASVAGQAADSGAGTGSLARLLKIERQEAATDWRQVVRRFLNASRPQARPSWRVPSRRFPAVVGAPLLPGRLRAPEGGELVVVLDTSGSMGTLLSLALAEILAMAAAAAGSLRLVQCDATVTADDRFDSAEAARAAIGASGLSGGGGTSMDPAMTLLADEDVPPRAVICVTDGYLTWPPKQPFDVLWVIVGRNARQVGRPDWGTVVAVTTP